MFAINICDILPQNNTIFSQIFLIFAPSTITFSLRTTHYIIITFTCALRAVCGQAGYLGGI